MKKHFYLLLFAGLSACSTAGDESAGTTDITFNNFESTAGWGGIDDAGLTDEEAHSGKYAIKVDATREYSLNYETVLGKTSTTRIKTIRIEGWIFAPSDKATATLGVQLVDPAHGNQEIFSDGLKIGEAVKTYNKWVKVSKDITLPDSITSTQHLKLFLWRASAKVPVYADDLRISIVE